jgi:hypothetical protein
VKILFAAFVILSIPAVCQIKDAPPVPRTADSKPDLSGVWQAGTFESLTGQAAPPPQGAARPRREPAPYQPWAAAKVKEFIDRRGIDDPMGRCLLLGVPRVTASPMPFQIIQMPGQMVFLYETFHTFRLIPTDGRMHPEDLEPSFMGDSVGHWEGDTLVVDVVGFNDKTWLAGIGSLHSDALHVTERYTRTSYDTLSYDVTMEDPKVFTKPWNTHTIIKLRPGDRIREYECGENNEDILRFEQILRNDPIYKKQP